MKRPVKPIEWIVWSGLAVTIAAIAVAFLIAKIRQARQPALDVFFPVGNFTLTNQAGRPFGMADLRGKVWVADIVFTKCAGPCPRMTQRMAELQEAVPAELPVQFVTLTTDPEFDTPAVLQAYARRFGAKPARWQFLTGSKQQIQELAVRGLKLTAVEKEPGKMENPVDLFIHSTLFVLVDKQGRVRAAVETESAEGEPPLDWKSVILPKIARLLEER